VDPGYDGMVVSCGPVLSYAGLYCVVGIVSPVSSIPRNIALIKT
jgi:hypothetical protein